MAALGLNLVLFWGVGVEMEVTASHSREVEPWIDGGEVKMMSSLMSHFGETPHGTGSLLIS